jgi:hypothetical protein
MASTAVEARAAQKTTMILNTSAIKPLSTIGFAMAPARDAPMHVAVCRNFDRSLTFKKLKLIGAAPVVPGERTLSPHEQV